MSESFPSFDYTVSSLREKGYTLVESTMVVTKCGVDHSINSIKVTGPRGNRVEIYARQQYATDSPDVGMFIDCSGMSYGDRASNSRVYRLDDILDRLS